MSLYRCPGVFKRRLDSVLVTCPSCGREAEIFSDEPSRPCRCGKLLRREATPTCADWCPAAAECVGEDIDPAEHRRRVERLKDDPRAKEYVECIRRQVKQSADRKDD